MGMTAFRLRERRERARLAALTPVAEPVTAKPEPEPIVEEPKPEEVKVPEVKPEPEPIVVTRPSQSNGSRRR